MQPQIFSPIDWREVSLSSQIRRGIFTEQNPFGNRVSAKRQKLIPTWGEASPAPATAATNVTPTPDPDPDRVITTLTLFDIR
jgi:hypothetical protein